MGVVDSRIDKRTGIMKLTSLLFATTAVTAKSNDPETRLNALREKVLEVVTMAGWDENSKLYGRVNKKTSIVIAKSKQMRWRLKEERGCEFPAHWTGRSIRHRKTAANATIKTTRAWPSNRSSSALIAGCRSTQRHATSQMRNS